MYHVPQSVIKTVQAEKLGGLRFKLNFRLIINRERVLISSYHPLSNNNIFAMFL